MDGETEGNSADLSNTPESRKNSWQIFFEEIVCFFNWPKTGIVTKVREKNQQIFSQLKFMFSFCFFKNSNGYKKKREFWTITKGICQKLLSGFFPLKGYPPHTGQVGDHTTCSQKKHVGEFLYFKLPKLPVQVKSRAIKDVTKYVLNTDVQFTN